MDTNSFEDQGAILLAHSDGCSVRQFRNETGDGTMTAYDVFPGVVLSFNDFHMGRFDSSYVADRRLFAIDHCREGRMEYAPGDGMLAYTEAGDMKLDLRMLMFVFFSFSIFASLEPISDSAHVLGVIDEAMDQLDALRSENFIDADGRDIALEHYDIEFRNVDFGYDTRQVLKNVSFTIPERTSTAIVGPSGSGKTTICSLLQRFYDPQGGAVLIGGHDLREFTCDSLLGNISMVFQNVYLFNDTIRANILFGRLGAVVASDLEDTKPHRKDERHGHEQDAAFDMRHSLSQNLQVRLRNSNGKAEQEADTENQRHILCSGQRRANLAADGRHGLLCAEGKQPHSNDQHHRAYQKAQQQIGAHRRDHEAQQKHYDRDGQHRQRGFNDFLFDCGSVYFQLS